MSNANFKQFKLTNGDEIVCEYMDTDENEGVAIVRAAMKIIEIEEADQGYSYFAFRPFMAFTNDLEQLQVIQLGHIISETNPSKNMMVHYASTIGKMSRFLQSGKTMEELDEMPDEDFDEIMEEWEQMEADAKAEKDPRGENIIKLKPKTDTFH